MGSEKEENSTSLNPNDHRVLGSKMDLFHMQEEAAGMVFWHGKGWTLWRTLENYMRERLAVGGYEEIKTPQLYDSSLFKASGHLDHFSDNIFAFHDEHRTSCLKPMNCPGHVQVFNQGIKSYRDLPIRLAEFGSCHRNEPSGSLHGIMRVKAFTQDDAHIFCTEDQILSEADNYFKLQLGVYKDLGFHPDKIKVKLALRPEEKAGDDQQWDKAEDNLREALKASQIEWEELPGEGAFYGPKVEFHLIDSQQRQWQCGTLQLDFVLPERLDASYVGEDNNKHRPVMLHRAVLGSMERFIGIMLEHYEGKLPLWLSPLQCSVLTVTNDNDQYALEVAEKLSKMGIRTKADTRNEKIGYKVRESIISKTPVVIVVGNKEKENGTVTVRTAWSKNERTMGVDDASSIIYDHIAKKDTGPLVL